MTGRLEKEDSAKRKMEKKLSQLPDIFTSFYNWMDARDKSYTTMDNYINHAAEFMEFYTKGKNNNKFYESVTEDHIEKFMNYIRRKNVNGQEIEVGDEIRAAKWSSLNTFFKFLSQRKYISSNPMLLTERPKIKTKHTITYMTPDEITSVFEKIKMDARKVDKNRDMCIMAIGLGTGLRVSAIVNINVEDIDFRANTIKVIEKGRKTKEVKFSDNIRNILVAWLKDREVYFNGGSDGPLFISQKKNRLSVDSVQNIVKKYTKHLPKKITPHKLRSSAAMNLHGAGVDVLTIASLLGHENVTTTQRYVEAYERDKQNATDILDSYIK